MARNIQEHVAASVVEYLSERDEELIKLRADLLRCKRGIELAEKDNVIGECVSCHEWSYNVEDNQSCDQQCGHVLCKHCIANDDGKGEWYVMLCLYLIGYIN